MGTVRCLHGAASGTDALRWQRRPARQMPTRRRGRLRHGAKGARIVPIRSGWKWKSGLEIFNVLSETACCALGPARSGGRRKLDGISEGGWRMKDDATGVQSIFFFTAIAAV